MTAGLPAGRKLIVEKPRPWGREEREQGDEQRPREARDVVPVGRLEGFCLALGKRVIQACGARVARSQAAKECQTPSGGYCMRERTA